MSLPTLQGVTVNSVASALTIFYAVSLGIVPKVERRLDVDERESLKTGDVYVWEERDLLLDAAEGIERWTDGIKWGSSRVRNEFLFYYERDHDPKEPQAVQDARLIKQTFSVFFHPPEDPRGRPRKWHMVAYYSQATVGSLRKVEDIPEIATLRVPESMFQPARARRGRTRSAESTSPTTIPLARHSIPPVASHSQHMYSVALRAPPRSPYYYGSASPETTEAAYTPDRHWHGPRPLRTPDFAPQPVLRRTMSSGSGNPRVHRGDLTRACERSPDEIVREKRPRLSPPYSETQNPLRTLPFPVISRVTNIPRTSADDRALSALQTRFMK